MAPNFRNFIYLDPIGRGTSNPFIIHFNCCLIDYGVNQGSGISRIIWMSNADLALLSPGDAGCNAKLSAGDLLGLLPNADFGLLAPDCERMRIAEGVYSTIDTIFPVTRDAAAYARIAVIHAFNDLYAKGAQPIDICASIAITPAFLKSGAARNLIDEISKTLTSFNAFLTKGHTYFSRDISVTIAAAGRRESVPPSLEKDRAYKVILTKPLGASIAYYLGTTLEDSSLSANGETSMLQDHSGILDQLQLCSDGSTDISGFGLVGHLAAAAIHHKLEIALNAQQIPFVHQLVEVPQLTSLSNCSSKRNRSDFDKMCVWNGDFSPNVKTLLCAGETSGPIACIIDVRHSKDFLTSLKEKGFTDAAIIGDIYKSDRIGVTIS